MKDPFHEDWQNPEADPLARTADDFDYEAVFARMDGEGAPTTADLSNALRQLLTWLVEVSQQPGKARTHITARALAMVWTINPAMLQGRSLNQVAKAFGVSPDTIHRASADFSRRFKFRNHAQRHAWNWKPEASPCPVAIVTTPRSPKPPAPPM